MLKRTFLASLWLLLLTTTAWAGSTAVTGELVYPSQNDLSGSGVGGAAGDGKKLLETQWRKIAGPLNGQNNYTLTGGTLPATDPDLTISIAAGTAVLDGHFVQWPATNVTLPASNTSHLFLKLVFGGGLVTGVEFEDNTSDAPPASSTKLGTATTSGSAVTSTTDARILGPGAQVVLTSGTSYPVPAGISRLRARLYGASGGSGGGGEGQGISSVGGNGTAGTAGGTTTFGSLTANGGGGGSLGYGGGVGGGAAGGGQHGTASGGDVNLTGGGMRGGAAATGGNAGFANGGFGGSGGPGGDGGYCEKILAVTPGSLMTYSIGAAGTAGIAGSGGGEGEEGSAGQSGLAGRIVLDFF